MLFLPVIISSIYKLMDKIMLGSMNEITELGFYENAEKIINVPITIITAIGIVMLPRMSSLLSKNKVEESKSYIYKTMIFVMFFSTGAAFGMASIAKVCCVIFYGGHFARSGIIMIYLAVTIIFIGCGNVIRTQYIIPNKMDNIYIISAAIGAVVNFIINFILIPILGAVGAAIGTIVAEFLVLAYQMFHTRHVFNYKDYVKKEIVFCILGVLMLGVILILPSFSNRYLELILSVFIGFVVYSILSRYYIKSILKIDIFKMLKYIINRKI